MLTPVFYLCLQDLRRKAARLVSAKCTLASRVDSFHESSDGKVTVRLDHMHNNTEIRMFKSPSFSIFSEPQRTSTKTLSYTVVVFCKKINLTPGVFRLFVLQVGYDLKEEIERKFDKWQEPPPVKMVKPLPAPLDGQRKKRGGRRYTSCHLLCELAADLETSGVQYVDMQLDVNAFIYAAFHLK